MIINIFRTAIILIACVLFSNKLIAKTWFVNQNYTFKKNSNPGSKTNPFKTMSEAALVAMPGDTVLVYSGVYRERVAPNNGGTSQAPIVYMVAPGEEVLLKGSEVWQKPWKHMEGNVYSSELDKSMLNNHNPYFILLSRMQGRKSLGQIFCNGIYLMQVDSLDQVRKIPGSWMLGYDSTSIYINYPKYRLNIPIEKCEIEYTVRGKIFAPHKRGLGYIHVEGFALEHCANQFPNGFYHKRGFPQSGAISTRSGHHWTIRRNTIRYAKTLGIDCGYEGAYDNEGDQPTPDLETIGYHLIEHNTISDCGAGGIAGAHQKGTIIRYNRIDRTNNLGFTAPETGGIKVHFFYDGVVEGNVFFNNDCAAIWFDNEWYNSRITRNVVIGSSGKGIFVEMGNGKCLVDNNIIAYTRSGDGIYTHDASGVTMANNLLFANAHFGIYMRVVTERKAYNEHGVRETVGTSNQRILNNVFIDNYRGNINLPLSSEKVANNYSDYNLFINGTQWQWEAGPFYSFALNKNNGMTDHLQREQEVKKLWIEASASPIPDLTDTSIVFSRLQQPLLSFEQWKRITEMDQNSMTPKVREGVVENGALANGSISLSSLSLELIIKNPEPFLNLKSPKLTEVTYDFYGNPRNSDFTIPGPFSNIANNTKSYFLIPPVIH